MDDLTVSRPIPSPASDDRGQPPARRRPRPKPKAVGAPAPAEPVPPATAEAADDQPHLDVLA
jgi:hypothetical protein